MLNMAIDIGNVTDRPSVQTRDDTPLLQGFISEAGLQSEVFYTKPKYKIFTKI